MQDFLSSLADLFLSTPSARRATETDALRDELDTEFLSTPSARRATRRCKSSKGDIMISIHALREEGDL